MKAMYTLLSALGVFIEVLPTIIVKQSSFVFFCLELKFFSHVSTLDEKAKDWSNEVV